MGHYKGNAVLESAKNFTLA